MCRRSSPRRPSPRPPPPRCSHRYVLYFSLFSLLFKGGFWSGFLLLRRGIKLSFFPRNRRRRFIIVVVVFLSLFGKTPNDARLSVPGATNRCDASIRRLVVAPARFGWCKGRRASSSRSSVRRRRRRDEDKRWERFRPKIVSLFGFLPKTRSQKSSQRRKESFKKKRKKEREENLPSSKKKE